MHGRRSFFAHLAVVTAAGATSLVSIRKVFGKPRERDATDPFSGKPEFIQPDYAAWAKIQKGMTETEVVRLLGEPLKRGKPPQRIVELDPSVILTYRWVYGRIDFKSPAVFVPYEFCVRFSSGRVFEKEDPFGAQLSTDGKPTVPRLVYPLPGSVYDHFPRYLDLRWYPSSGRYPMRYRLECQAGGVYPGEWQEHLVGKYEADIPYLLYLHGGSQPGRWRVKAVNAVGESGWSKWREFAFAV